MTHLGGDALLKMPLLLTCCYVYHLSIILVNFRIFFLVGLLGGGEGGGGESSITFVGVATPKII